MLDGSCRKALPRFGLRAILALLTLASVASWAYWQGWDQWRWHSEQRTFLDEVKLLKSGQPSGKYNWAPSGSFGSPLVRHLGHVDLAGRYTRSVVRRWPNAWFVVFMRFDGNGYSSIEVFRIPPAPSGYVARGPRTRVKMIQWGANRAHAGGRPKSPQEMSQLAYESDFLEMVRGDRRDDLGFDYSILYVDPPPTE